MLHLGARAHDFGKLPPAELAARVAAQGLTCVQLALNKAIAGLDLQPGDLNPGLGFTVGQAFQRHGIQIAVLGCYINLLHPDPATRAMQLGFFKEHLRYARDFGCGLVATETGSFNADYSPHPANHGELALYLATAAIAALAREAEKWGVIVGIEGVASHAIYTPARMRRLLDSIASRHVQVVFDPVNLLSGGNYQEQDRILKESFDLFGDRIAIVHAKDFRPEAGALRQLRSGQGLFNYPLLLEWLRARKPGIAILLEENTPETIAESIAFLRNVNARCSPAS